MDAIFQRHLDTIYRIACANTRHTADAEDVTQDVFLEYLRRQPKFESDEHEKAWFVRVTMHRSRDIFRTAWRRRVQLTDAQIDTGAHTNSGNDSDMHAALLSLPANDRTILYLYYYESADVQTIARMLKLSKSAVEKRLQRARAKLKTILGGD